MATKLFFQPYQIISSTMTSYRHGINTLALTVTVALYISSGTNVSTVEGFTATTTNNAPSIMTNRIQLQQLTIMMMTSADDEEESADTELPVSGSFFNEVSPPKQDDESDSSTDNNIDDGGTILESESSNILESDFSLTSSTSSSSTTNFDGDDTDMFQQIIQNTKLSTSSGKGFSKTTSTTDHTSSTLMQTPGSSKPFVGIGKPANDVSNPEYDENGYTVYTDETTGKKSRVFDALVEYPSIFKMKIVGSDDDPNRDFESDIVDVVAKSCGVDRSMVKHTQRKNGKWISVTVYAPVESSDMLYSLYENVDKDDRVKVRI